MRLEKILLDSHGNCKISGYGECSNYYEKIENNWVHEDGTINPSFFSERKEYYAPEVFMNYNRVEYSADYWALGCMIYQMISGRMPFLNKESIQNDEIPNLEELEISKQAKDLIASLLVKDQFKRLGSIKNPRKITHDPFFSDINWKNIEELKIEAPFKPNVVIFNLKIIFF